MGIFYQEVKEPTRKCKCLLASALKHAFAKCHSLRGNLHSTPQPEETPIDFDQEEEIFVSAVISKYMESKSKRKSSNFGIDSIYWAVSPSVDAEDEYFSAGGGGGSGSGSGSGSGVCVSISDAFVSAESRFSYSRCSSLKEFEDLDKRRSMILELIHCQGWPFGLCRKALLLPPLPKSPADSWLWTRSGTIIKFIL